MGEAKRKRDQRIKQEAFTEISKHLTDSGRMVETGFEIHRHYYLKDETPENVERFRECFMLGGQHVFSTIMVVLEEGEEITDNDMNRMTLIYEELENFVRHFKAKHDVSDEVYPQQDPDNVQ